MALYWSLPACSKTCLMKKVPSAHFDYRMFTQADRLPAFRQMTASLDETWPKENRKTSGPRLLVIRWGADIQRGRIQPCPVLAR
jgi:hypothetical protein